MLGALCLAGSLASAQPSPPGRSLGFEVGSDRNLADWGQIVGYFEHLAKESPRLRLETVGRSTEDRPFLLAYVSSPENLAKLEDFRQIQRRLADPRLIGGSADPLIAQGKAIVLITCGIHSTEVASPLMSMEFAWEMATGEDAETREILENVIFLLVPSLNPDGVDIVARWYRQTLGTPAEGTPPPELYHKYVGHDNNRDWYMFTQKETRIAVAEIHNRWHPQIVYDVHQMGTDGARIFVPPFIDPVEPNVDPILQAQIVDLGGWMFSRLIGAGKQGVVTNAIYDAFTPARAYQHYHGGVRILSESASAKLATPIEISAGKLGPGRNFDASQASWNFPVPWPGGVWRLRDIVEDQKIALKAVLLHAARNRENWLSNFVRVGRRNLEREGPFAFVLPPAAEQADAQGLFDLLETLDFGGVEILRAERDFEVAEAVDVAPPYGRKDLHKFSTGTFIVLLKQPYGSFAKTMLEVQEYPELRQCPGGPLKRPYDVTAHTLGIQLGVEVYRIDQPFQVETRLVQEARPPDGEVTGAGDFHLFPHANNAFAKLANRLLAQGLALYWAPNGFRAEGRGYPVGTLMARGKISQTSLESILKQLPITIHQVRKWPELAWQKIGAPRIGLYRSRRPAMDEGWTRWILEQYEFPYRSLDDAAIRGGDLSELDVIVLPDQSPQAIKDGLGDPYPEALRGGLGDDGLRRLKMFAEAGGTIVFLGQSALLPIKEWDIGVSDRLGGLEESEFYVPGSLLRAKVHNRHPIGYGMEEETGLMFLRSPAFDLTRALSIVDYPEKDLLLSGWIDGGERLAGASGLAVAPLGEGRLVLIGFRTQFRAQARATYKFLFNALYWSTVGGRR